MNLPNRRSSLLRILWLAAGLLLSHPSSGDAVRRSEPVYVGDVFRLESKTMNETRRYLVHLPKDYAFVKNSYPVLILLDGDAHFPLASSTVDLLTSTGRIPPMIVVGVGNTDRFRDMSPLPPAPAGSAPQEDWPKKFLGFISDELIPEIDRNYRTRPYRVLVGHSVGGLFVVYSMMQRPETFKGYISISPAFGDNRELVKAAAPFLQAHKNLQADFYMTMANEGGIQLGGAWELSSIFQENASRDLLRWQFQRHPDQDHFSMIHHSVYDGLQSIFRGWRLHDPFTLYEQGGLPAIEKHFASLSARVGYDVPIAEEALTTVLNSLAQRKRYAEGEPVVQKVLQLYPRGFQTQFTLGRFFRGSGDDKRAIVHYSRLLELYPDYAYARRLLTELKVDPNSIAPAPPVEAAAVTPRDYVGRYRAPDVELQITEENGTLYATIGLDRHRLVPRSATRFQCVDGDKQFTFQKNKQGRYGALVVQQAGVEVEMARLN